MKEGVNNGRMNGVKIWQYDEWADGNENPQAVASPWRQSAKENNR